MKAFWLALIALTAAPAALAAEKSTAKAPEPPRWKLLGYLQSTSSLQRFDDASYQASASIDTLTYFRVNDRLMLRADFSANQELTDEQRFSLGNPELRAFWSAAKLGRSFELKVGPSALLAFNRDSWVRDSLRGGLGGFARLLADFGSFGGYYEVAGSTLLHQYRTSTLGKVNSAFQLEHALVASYTASKLVALMASGGFASSWSYEGNVKNSYSIRQEIDVTLNPTWQIGIGHVRGGDLFSANGRDLNVGIFSPNSSRVYMSLNFQL